MIPLQETLPAELQWYTKAFFSETASSSYRVILPWHLFTCDLQSSSFILQVALQLSTSPSRQYYTAWKVSKYGVFSNLYFLVFGLNTERYGVSLRYQSKRRKIQTRKNSVSAHFPPSTRYYLSNEDNYVKPSKLICILL